MLVLGRRPGQTIQIGEDVTITIQRITTNTVKVGIDCPKDKSILRGELISCPPPPEVQSP